MKKIKPIYIILPICVFTVFLIFGISYIKNSRENTTSITQADNHQTINASSKSDIKLTLPNPGDGGYQFDEPIFDSSIIKLTSHKHTNPSDKTLGNFGDDIWTFEILKKGQTDLTINISRPWEDNSKEEYFQATIVIQE